MLALLTILNVDVGAGPEPVGVSPLQRLPLQSDGAVVALEVRGQPHVEGLRSANRTGI